MTDRLLTSDLRSPMEFAVCMGMDAMRICLGIAPRNFTRAEIIRWMECMP